MKRNRRFEYLKDFLEEQMENGLSLLGQAGSPALMTFHTSFRSALSLPDERRSGCIRRGSASGVRQAWLCGQRAVDTGATRSPIREIAFFLAHRSQNAGGVDEILRDASLEKLRRVLAEGRRAQIKGLRALFDSVLH